MRVPNFKQFSVSNNMYSLQKELIFHYKAIKRLLRMYIEYNMDILYRHVDDIYKNIIIGEYNN